MSARLGIAGAGLVLAGAVMIGAGAVVVGGPDAFGPATAPHGYGMMGGYGGYGMMGGFGHGAWGMGPGAMGYGFGAWGDGLDLSQAQDKKIGEIQKALFDKQWPLMQAMHETMMKGAWAAPGARLDVDAVMKRAKALSDIRLQMLRNRLESLQQFQAVLTPEQRKELQGRGPWGR